MNDPIQEAQEPRYDFEAVDLTSGCTHADVVLLAGENTRILELGPATGYMSRAFKDRGCAVVAVELLTTVVRRRVAGRPLFAGDRSHAYDRLRDLGWSVAAVSASSSWPARAARETTGLTGSSCLTRRR